MRSLTVLLAALFWMSAARADDMNLMGVGTTKATSAAFLGVADEETSITLCGGLVACSAALATAQAKLVDLSNNSTTCVGVKSLTTGQMDVSVGLYCNGGTQTVTTWCSTNCTYSSGVARVTKVYEQVGGTLSWTSANYAVSPYFILSSVNSNPALACVSANTTLLSMAVSNIGNPYSVGVTYTQLPTNNTGFGNYTFGNFSVGFTNGGAVTTLQYFNNADSFTTPASSNASSNTDTTHFVNALVTYNGAGTLASSYINGVAGNTHNPGGVSNLGTTIYMCGNSIGADALIRRVWYDPTVTANALAVTNSSNVSF